MTVFFDFLVSSDYFSIFFVILDPSGKFGDLRFEKLAFRQRFCEKSSKFGHLRLEKMLFGQVRFEKLAFNQRICEKMVIFVNFEKRDLKSWHSDKEFVKKS